MGQPRATECGHPERTHEAKGMCRNCYHLYRRRIPSSGEARYRARYDASEKGRATQARYNNSFKGLMRSLDHQIGRQQRVLQQLREALYGA